MIDEQHPMQIGMFPLDIKCHTPQQLQQQQQQQTTSLLMSGNERMLTTSTTTPTTTATVPLTAATTANGNGVSSVNTATGPDHGTINGKSGNASHATTNVNGSCHNGSNNSNSNSSNSVSNHINSSKTNGPAGMQQSSQSHPDGPGPPPPILHAPHTTASGRVTLAECSLNGGGAVIGCGGGAGNMVSSLCANGHSAMALTLQQHLHQQHQQQHLQMNAPHQHPPALLLHASSHHPAAIIANTSASVMAADACGGGGGISPLLTQCGYCCQPICDRYIMRVVDTSFHEGCLKCATCSLHLVHSCFARDGKLYCRIDYERLFIRNRCLGCGHKIASDELVMRTLENVFHLKCFACVVCGALLKKGEQYVVKQGQLFCRFDYEKEVEMLQGYDFYGDDLFPPKLDGRRGPKRPRTILNTQQRRAFKASFEVSPKPCRKVRENLAKETGLSLRIVQVWFQNQRAKVKKIQKKAKQEHAKGASDSQDSQESDSSLAKIKDEAHSDTESLESPFSSCGGGGGGGSNSVGGGSSSEAITKLRCIKDENENAPFNCMETNKENCNKTNEPILNTILGLSYATFQQLMGPFTQSPMINPIDRLYSMQNSYFRPEELSYGECSKDGADNL